MSELCTLFNGTHLNEDEFVSGAFVCSPIIRGSWSQLVFKDKDDDDEGFVERTFHCIRVLTNNLVTKDMLRFEWIDKQTLKFEVKWPWCFSNTRRHHSIAASTHPGTTTILSA